MYVSYEHCGQSHQVKLTDGSFQRGPLRCCQCNAAITGVDVSGSQSWIELQVERKRGLAQDGRLGTRKQATRQTDEQIDRDGLSAELAACSILCPRSLTAWCKATEASKGNRGRDLLRRWTGLNKAVEVKHTRYHDAERGFLLVRPPRQTPGRMRVDYIDDALYVLMAGEPFQHRFVGWTDRDRLISNGRLNPVPIQPGQRESWGMHWSQLEPIDELAAATGVGGPLAEIWRWFADYC